MIEINEEPNGDVLEMVSGSLSYMHLMEIQTQQLALVLAKVAAIYWNKDHVFTPAMYCLRRSDSKLQLEISHLVI